MMIVCAWCKALMGYKCPFCGEPLHEPEEPHLQGRWKGCHGKSVRGYIGMRHHPAEILISMHGMQETHGICDDCADRMKRIRTLGEEEAAKLEAELPATPTNLPSAADLDAIEQERETGRATEKKGVPQAPGSTERNPADQRVKGNP